MPLRKKEEAKQKFDSFGKNFTLEEARTNVYILIDEIYEAKDQEIAELKELTQKKSCKAKKILKGSFYSITDCDEDTQQFADNKKVKKAIKILTNLEAYL